MPSLEAVCGRLFGRPGWIPKALWGGLLSFVPILNLLALGYLLEFAKRLRSLGDWELPEWRDMNFPTLLYEGLRAFVILLGYAGLPLLTGWLLSKLLDLVTFGLLGIVSHFPLAVMGFVGPFLFLSAIHSYLNDGIYADAWQIRQVLTNAQKLWPRLAIPVVAFWGIFLLAIPLYGLSFFLGFWVLIAYSTALQISD
jgi:hypothetical protein